jgi:pimeloyl-ACP methyl ester carboxylesterase
MFETLRLQLPSGRLHVERTAPADVRATAICVHGLTANVRSWDLLREELAAAGVQTVAMDLRGRGHSEVTAPGTYGLEAHARDVVAIADALELPRWHHVGWSMGALVGLQLAGLAGDRLQSMVLVDHAGAMDPAALDAVRAGTVRLDAVVPDHESYHAAMRQAGIFEPWGPFWERYFSWELGPAEGGLSPTTDRAAILEDIEEAARDFTVLWPHLTMPTLLVRASEPLGGGLIVPEAVRDALVAQVPGTTVHPVARNHYSVMTDASARQAIVAHVTAAT